MMLRGWIFSCCMEQHGTFHFLRVHNSFIHCQRKKARCVRLQKSIFNALSMNHMQLPLSERRWLRIWESQWWYCSHFNSVSTWPTYVSTIYQQHCYRNALQFTFLNFSLLKRYVWSCLPHTFLLPKPVGDPDEDDWQYTSDDKHFGTMCFCHLRRLRLQNSKWWSASGAFGLVRLSVVRRYFCLCVAWYLFEACRGPISETRLVSSCFFLLFLWFLNSSRTKIPRAL